MMSSELSSDEIRSLIGGKLVLTPEQGAISLVREKGKDHAFLIIEGKVEDGKRIAKEAHLTWKYVRDSEGKCILEKNKPKRNYQKADIMYFDMKPERLEELVAQGGSDKYIAKTFPLDAKERETLNTKILADQKADIDYQVSGNKNTLFGASIGASLNSVGGGASKQASIDKVQTQGRPPGLLDISVESTLRKGHSCVSWAMETVKHVKPEFSEKTLSKLLVVVPSHELPDPGTSCRIL